MTETTPTGLRLLNELTDGRQVALALRTGELVRGWLLVGVPSPQARTYWTRHPPPAWGCREGPVPVHPVGWVDLDIYGYPPWSRWDESAPPARAPAGHHDHQARPAAGSAQRSRRAQLGDSP